MKRTFGWIEGAFDIVYLLAAAILGLSLLVTARDNSPRLLAGVMALVLAGGDAFHLLPRMAAIFTGRQEEFQAALGLGKQITSITMTIFYILLWQIGRMTLFPAVSSGWTFLVYGLAAVRMVLCLFPQNGWTSAQPSLRWGILRNIPFFLLGGLVAVFFFRFAGGGLGWMWLAILLSFACYLPVVLWVHRNPKIGMLMLPKTCAYLWMLALCLSL